MLSEIIREDSDFTSAPRSYFEDFIRIEGFTRSSAPLLDSHCSAGLLLGDLGKHLPQQLLPAWLWQAVSRAPG